METAGQFVSAQVVVGFAEQRLSQLAGDILHLGAHSCAVLDAERRIAGLIRFCEVAARPQVANRILSDLMAPPPLTTVLDTDTAERVQHFFERDGVQEIAVVRGAAQTFVGLITPASFSAWLLANERARKAEMDRLLQDQKRLADFLEKKVAAQLTGVRTALDEFGRMCVALSHDIRQPLRTIQSFGEFLAGDEAGMLNADGRDATERIIKVARKAEALAENLLGQARVSFGDKSQTLGAIDLDEVLADALEFLDAEIRHSGARVQSQRTLGKVTGYYVPVLQVFINLILNALKHVAPGKTPEVGVRTETQGDNVVLYVQDNGVGISEAHCAALSAPLQSPYGTSPQGTGFGLKITRNALEVLGGNIEAVPSSGGGTLFILNLPRYNHEIPSSSAPVG